MARNSLAFYTALARERTKASVGEIMAHLNKSMTLAESKFIDFSLGLVETPEGVAQIEHWLFHGTQIQRIYCTLFFGRRGDYEIIRKAYDLGLIDAKQAFSK